MDDGSEALSRSTLQERVAARALDVDLNADPFEVRRAFRREVKAIHPDSSVDEGCPDIGRLADARDVLFHRYARLVTAGLVEPIDPPTAATDRQLSGDDWLRRFEAQDARLVRERRLKEQVERMMREETAAYRAERERIRKLAEENKRRLERTLRTEAPAEPVAEPKSAEPAAVQRTSESRREQLLREILAAERERRAALRVLARQRAAAQISSVARPKPPSESTITHDTRPRVPQPDDGIGIEVDLAG